VWLSGAEGEEPTATLALCMGGIDLMQPPTPNPKSLHQGHCARSVRSAGSRSGHLHRLEQHKPEIF
jgi:hypothetical protein